MFAARVRAGFNHALKRLLLEQFPKLATTACPFRNLPERTKGRWGDGLTAQDMQNCRWLKRVPTFWSSIQCSKQKRLLATSMAVSARILISSPISNLRNHITRGLLPPSRAT